MNALIVALQKLDPDNNEHWTGDGLPKVDTLKNLTGLFSLTREQITTAAPTFTREMWRNSPDRLGTVATAAVTTPAVAPVVTPAPVVPPVVAATTPAPAQPPAVVTAPPVIEPVKDENEEEPATTEKQLEAKLALAAAALEKANADLRVFAAAQKEASDAVDNLVIELDRLRVANPARPVNEIQQYLASQMKLREDRSKQVVHLKPDLRAPIDRALGRK